MFNGPVNTNKEGSTKRISVALTAGVSILDLSFAVETFRSVNRILARQAYQWEFVSVDGQAVLSSAGIYIDCTRRFGSETGNDAAGPAANLIMLCPGSDLSSLMKGPFYEFLRHRHNAGATIAAVADGVRLLAKSGLLNGRRCAVHWEEYPAFRDEFPDTFPCCQLFELDDRIYTCAGGAACLDMLSFLIGNDFGDDLVQKVCQQHLTDKVRPGGRAQLLRKQSVLGVTNPKVQAMIGLMEENLTAPKPVDEIATWIGLSRRQIERLFLEEKGTSPGSFYKELRLNKAKTLLEDTCLTIGEIAQTCGFVSRSHFSKSFKDSYGAGPTQVRDIYRRGSWQFR